MKALRLLKQAAVGLACLGVVVPQSQLMAATPKEQVQNATVISDVKLAANGTLSGHVIDAQGVGTEGALVSIRVADREVAQTATDAGGRYVVRNLRGGVYQIVSGQSTQFVRAWAPGTAPPAAHEQALLVSGGQVVRGQFGGDSVSRGVTGATLGISIASLVIGIITLSKVNDNEDMVIGLQGNVLNVEDNVNEIFEAVDP